MFYEKWRSCKEMIDYFLNANFIYKDNEFNKLESWQCFDKKQIKDFEK